MVPTASEIARGRFMLVGAARILLLVLATGLTVTPTAFATAVAAADEVGAAGDVFLVLLVYNGIVLGVLGTLWALTPVIVRTATPARMRSLCPGCGYGVQGLPTDQCPECGLRLPPEFFDMKPPPSRSTSDEAFTRRTQIVVGALLRVMGVVALLPGPPLLLYGMPLMLYSLNEVVDPWGSYWAGWFLFLALTIVACGVVLVAVPRRLARLMTGTLEKTESIEAMPGRRPPARPMQGPGTPSPVDGRGAAASASGGSSAGRPGSPPPSPPPTA